MWLFNQASSAARTVLFYITGGAFIVIWSIMWYVYLYNNVPDTSSAYYWCTGFLVSGLTMILIGLWLGRIDRPAQAANPPPEATIVAAATPQTTAPAPAAEAPPAVRQA